jgi:membrane fusion protein, protease secretion system
VQFHEYLQLNSEDPFVIQHKQNQTQLFESRRRELQADLAAMHASIASLRAQIQGLEAVMQSKQTQSDLVKEHLNNLADLVKEGFATRTEQNELEQRHAQLMAEVNDTRSRILSHQKSITEYQERIRSRQQAYLVEGDKEMTTIRQEVHAYEERLKAQADELSRVEIRSPVAGQVVDLQMQTVGGFIQQGEKIMNIVPFGEGLVLEAKVPPHLIDRVNVGLDADVRFSSFANSPQLFVEGEVASISRDLIVEPNPNQPDPTYYLARISITPDGMKKLGNREMQPGMPVQIVIKTGERSLLKYLLHPLTKRFAASLKEE